MTKLKEGKINWAAEHFKNSFTRIYYNSENLEHARWYIRGYLMGLLLKHSRELFEMVGYEELCKLNEKIYVEFRDKKNV